MSAEGLDALRSLVSGDPELARRLRDVEPERFAAEVMAVAARSGCDVDESDLAAARAEGGRLWAFRWIR
jgi:hypothetical protein